MLINLEDLSKFLGVDETDVKGMKSSIPKMDILESDVSYVLQMDAPGVLKENIEITVEDGTLLIRGVYNKRRTADESILDERPQGEFKRGFVLPEDVDLSGSTDAVLDIGVLHITLPKIKKQKPKVIKVK